LAAPFVPLCLGAFVPYGFHVFLRPRIDNLAQLDGDGADEGNPHRRPLRGRQVRRRVMHCQPRAGQAGRRDLHLGAVEDALEAEEKHSAEW